MTSHITINYCNDFIKNGSCKSGDYCRFAHPINEEDRLKLQNTDNHKICLRHLSGKLDDNKEFIEGCAYGDNCKYQHYPFTLNVSGLIYAANNRKDVKQQVFIRYCEHHVMDNCRNGKYCRYAHATQPEDIEFLRIAFEHKAEPKVCIYHLSGHRDKEGNFTEGCKNNSKCNFMHFPFTINPSGLINAARSEK